MKKLLTLLCVIALLGTLCVPALAAGEPVPVVAEVSADWTTAYLYAWKGTGGAGNEIAAWPGVPMTAIDGMFCTYMPADMENVIINDGNGTQSADLAVTPGQPVFVAAANIGEATVANELPIEVPSADELGVSLPSGSGSAAATGTEWYMAGDFNNWKENDAFSQMDDNGDGTFTGIIDIAAGNHAMKVTNGTWDVNYGGNGADGNLEFSTSDGELTVVFNTADCSITLSGADVVVGVVPPAAGDWYVAGEFNSWNQCDAGFKMEDDGDGTYSLSFDVTAGAHELKVTNGTWDVSFGKDGGADNLVFEAAADTLVTVEFDGASMVAVSGEGITLSDGPAPTEPVTPVVPEGSEWYVAGDFNNWNQCDAAYKMTDNGNGTFSVTFAMTTGAHELKVTNGTWDVSFGKDGGADNFVYEAAADGNVTVTFAVKDAAITVAAGDAPATEPAPGTDPTTDPTEATDPTTDTTGSGNQNGEGGMSSTTIGIIVAVAAVVVGGIVIFFILKKKD